MAGDGGGDDAASDTGVGDPAGGNGIAPRERLDDLTGGGGVVCRVRTEELPSGRWRDERGTGAIVGHGEDREPVTQIGRDESDDERLGRRGRLGLNPRQMSITGGAEVLGEEAPDELCREEIRLRRCVAGDERFGLGRWADGWEVADPVQLRGDDGVTARLGRQRLSGRGWLCGDGVLAVGPTACTCVPGVLVATCAPTTAAAVTRIPTASTVAAGRRRRWGKVKPRMVIGPCGRRC